MSFELKSMIKAIAELGTGNAKRENGKEQSRK